MKNNLLDSPRSLSRLGGILYLLIIAVGIFGEMLVRGRLVDHQSAVQTTSNIINSLGLWRVSILSELFLVACATVLVFVFYGLFCRINKSLSIIIVLLNLCAIGIEAANRFNLINVLVLLKSVDASDSAAVAAVAGQVSAYLQFYSYGFSFSLFVFAFVCMIIGYLIVWSVLVPRFIGILMIVAGACYLTITTTLIGIPRLEELIFPYIFLPILLAELSFASWLLLKGVDAEKWAGCEPATNSGLERE